MNEGLIPRRYAKALYKVAIERGCQKRMYDLMQTAADSFESNPDLQATISNPFVDNARKNSLAKIAAGADDTDSTFADFLKLLDNNRRIDMLHQIALAYLDIYRKANNIRLVEVVSASPLDPAVEKRIRTLVEQHLHGATMQFSVKTDPDIIGGFVINIDNERLDASLRNKLKELRLGLLN